MSSHREAPEISKDPVADNTDMYAFVSPDNPEHGHDHHQLPSGRGSGRRSELLRVRQRRPVLDLHRQRRRRAGGHHLPVRLRDAVSPTRTRSSTTPDRSSRWRTRTGTCASSTPSPRRRTGREPAQATSAAKVLGRSWRARRATSARARPRNTGRSNRKRSTRCRAARRFSPGSATTRSSWTSGRSSTWPTCDRSRTCT